MSIQFLRETIKNDFRKINIEIKILTVLYGYIS